MRIASANAINRFQDHLGLSGRRELWLAGMLFSLGTLFKVWNVFYYRFDSDESQHLHVIWAWTQGLVQYRDVFDNHMPLFHLLCAPILALLGDHPADLYWMRFLMVPLYFLSGWCLYRIGTIVFTRRIGVWAMLLSSGISTYHFCSTEFRTDVVWTLLWFLSLLIIVQLPFALRSYWTAGTLIGLGFAVSMKTTLMLGTTVLAIGIAITLVGWRKLELNSRIMAAFGAVLAFGSAIIPLTVIGFFVAAGLWADFQQSVFLHNLEPPTRNTYLNPLLLAFGLPMLIYITRRLIKDETDAITAFRRAFVYLTCGIYFLLLRGAWRHITRQDYLPFLPLLALICVALLFKLSNRLGAHGFLPRFARQVPLAGVFAGLVMLLDLAPRLPITDEADEEVGTIREVMALTDPGDAVFDCKGETVFRRRSVRYVLETLTLNRIKNGKVADALTGYPPEGPARVAVIGGDLSRGAESLIATNYLPVGHGVFVIGAKVHAPQADGTMRFRIAAADRYDIITGHRLVDGVLDGRPSSGSSFMDTGEHTFRPSTAVSAIAVLWAQAVDRHFVPLDDAADLTAIVRTAPPLLRPVSIFRH